MKHMRKDAADNREAIASAARHLFVEEGPGVSMRVIAKEAGVGVATATRHFPERFLLREAVFEQALTEIQGIVNSHLADFDEHPEQSWRETVHGFVGLKLPSLAQAIFAELIDEGDFERVRTRFDSGAVDRVRGIYADILESAAAAGLCPAGMDPVRFHLALAAVAKPLPAAEVLGEEYADQQEFVVNVLLDGFKVEAAR